MREKILSVESLSVSFKTSNGKMKVLRNINFDLYKGETLAIVGESGSGKSVTVKSIMGICSNNQSFDSGKILFNQLGFGEDEFIDLLQISKKERLSTINGRRIAMVFQDPMTSLDPTMTIGNQLMESTIKHLKYSKNQARKRAIELLELVGIINPEKRLKNYPHQLSGGMRQRIVIAIALSCNPEILICDEPTTALDVTIQAKILELIKDIQTKLNISVIYITHDLGVVAKVADYVAVMYAGRIIEHGLTNEIFYDPRHPYTWGLLSSMPDLSFTQEERLYTIPGSPPNLLAIKEGDPFAPRNPFALQIDYHEEPPLMKISETHYAATWLLDDRAPKIDMPISLKNRIQSMLSEVNADVC